MGLHGVFKTHLGEEDNYPEDPGSLSKEKVWDMMRSMGANMSTEEFDEQFKQIDLDGGGSLEFDEFMEMADVE